MSATADIAPEQLTCNQLAFVRTRSLDADACEVLRRRIVAELRWRYACYTSLALGTLSGFGVAATIASNGVIDAQPPPLGFTVFFGGLCTLVLTGAFGLVAAASCGRTAAVRWLAIVPLALIALASVSPGPPLATVVAAVAMLSAMFGIATSLLNVYGATVLPVGVVELHAALRDVARGQVWRFEGEVPVEDDDEDDEEAQDDEPEAQAHRFVVLDVLPGSGVILAEPELGQASLRPIAGFTSPYRDTPAPANPRPLLAIEQRELAVMRRRHAWATLRAGVGIAWVVSIALLALTHRFDVPAVFGAVGTAVVVGLALRRRVDGKTRGDRRLS